MKLSCRFFFVLLVLFLSQQAGGQYFGKNKVNYDRFHFKIYETPHFQIHYYFDNQEKLEDIGQLAERWYQRHQAVFLDTINERSPIILYSNHADFQQTTVISSIIGVGTGGVTEGMRNRVVMPVMKSNAETNHVLGHELVHVFQYNLFKNVDSVNFQSIGSIPLWMIEGLAEYMSIGSTDPHTAMWMRDAVMQDDVPTIEDMTRRPDKYFPYRYGHAFWSFITSRWGDAMIRPLLLASGMFGHERAIDSLFGMDTDTLSVIWKENLIRTHQPYLNRTDKEIPGEKMFDTPGAMNIAPSVSPDGHYAIFLADRDVITIDFYLADIEKERVVRRLTRDVRDTHIDNYSFTESTGTWSPDSRKYALCMFSEGEKKLLIFDIGKRSPAQTIDIGSLEYFDNPAWSPDGKSIVLAGLREGQSDLYRYHLESGQLEQLTDDYFSDLQPAWSPDGERLVFISDRRATDLGRINYGSYQLCEYHPGNDSLAILPVFTGTDNYSPQYNPDGSSIYFVSLANGMQNIYEYVRKNGDVYRLSDFPTGLSSLSELAPALSVARDERLLVYVFYNRKGYSIYKAAPEDFTREKVNPFQTDLSAAKLVPETQPNLPTVVDVNLDRYPLEEESDFSIENYEPDFALESVGSVGIGIGFDQTNTAAAGGVSFLFSDMLKRNQLFTALRVNGRLIDAGGQVTYINQKHRLNWGATFSHIPYLSIRSYYGYDTIESVSVVNVVNMERRIFVDQLSMFGIYPLSKKLRFEAGLSAANYSTRIDSVNYYYSPNGYYLGEEKTKLDSRDPFRLYSGYVAYVGDDAYFGLTSPLRGYRYRFQLGRTQGRIRYWELLGDYRQYYFFKPLGFAYRVMHYGRYGGTANDFNPMYLGYPYYMRGYRYRYMTERRCPDNNCLDVDQITGSKMLVAGAEARLPLSGPRRLSLIKSRIFFTDLVAFVDGGLAWFEFDDVAFSLDPSGDRHIPVFSTGLAVRLNLFGALILEPYYAIPLHKGGGGQGHLGIYISGGGW